MSANSSTHRTCRDEALRCCPRDASASPCVPTANGSTRAKGGAWCQKQGLRGKRALSPRGDDTGPSSAGEAERLRCRIEELQAQVRQRDITIERLRRDITELQKTSGDPMSVSEFQTAIKKWRTRSRRNAASSPGWRTRTRLC